MWKRTVSNRFSEKSGTYDQHALVQKEMAEELLSHVQAVVEPKQIRQLLEIGCGTGELTRLLCRSFPAANCQALDLALGMLEEARRKLREEGLSCTFLHADVEEWVWRQEADSLDAVVSGACFQWLSQPGVTLKGLAGLLKPGGHLLFSTFGPETFAELHASFGYAHASLGQPAVRHGLAFHSATEWKSMLAAAGFEDVGIFFRKIVLNYPGVRDFLHAVKAVGASATQGQSPGLGSKRLLLAMIEYYERAFGTSEGIPATYDLLYIRARSGRNSGEKHGMIGRLANLINSGECIDYGSKRNRHCQCRSHCDW